MKHFSLAKDSENFIYDQLKKLLVNVNQIAFENEITRKLPKHAVDASLNMTILPVF